MAVIDAAAREEWVQDLQASLEFANRTSCLVNYWFVTQGGGWVKIDWRRIAEIAADHLDLLEGVTMTTDNSVRNEEQ